MIGAIALALAWEEAVGFWQASVRLRPVMVADGQEGRDPLAWIDLLTRQVHVDLGQLEALGAASSLAAVLAHEVGHHVRYPHTAGEAAALMVLQRRVLPAWPHDLTNVFYDLLVNERVGQRWPEAIAAVYRGFVRKGRCTALMLWVLACYELLLDRPIIPKRLSNRMDERLPGWRQDARALVETMWMLESTHDSFVYFCARAARYLTTDDQQRQVPMAHDLPALTPEDLADAAAGSPLSDQALRRAVERGWIKGDGLTRDPLAVAALVVQGAGPGGAQAAFQRRVASRIYQRHVDRHLVALPGEGGPPDEVWLPTTTSPWEPGDDPAEIDWTASVLAAGPLAAALPVRRDREAEPQRDAGRGPASVEIWLDTSGSMPDPTCGLNAMTLAAQVLAAAAVRKQGRVRALVWASGPVLMSDWLYDETTARDFLLHYHGGGTDFPFALLQERVTAEPDVLRFLISDTDLGWCYARCDEARQIMSAAARSRLLVGLLHVPPGAEAGVDRIRDEMDDPSRVRWVYVRSPAELAEMAAQLADALLEDR